MGRPAIIWCNLPLAETLRASLIAAVGADRLLWADAISPGNVPVGAPDARLPEADIVFGQPEASQCATTERLRWIALSSAGYGAFDTAPVRAALQGRGTILTTSSAVYAEPCAQHVLGFMLSEARRFPIALAQQAARSWIKTPLRRSSFLLAGQIVLLVGYGSIGRRLAELLVPFDLEVVAVRRQPAAGGSRVKVVPPEALDSWLPRADHVVDLLPGNPETAGFFSAARLAAMKPDAIFYNIGRGTTVDQPALAAALERGHLGAAYLDVTEPEPLPAEHPLWTTPRCVVTPHTAGGHRDEQARLVKHFLANLARHEAGEPLVDRVL